MNLKKDFIKNVLKIKQSHSFKTSSEDLIGFWFKRVEGEALSLILKDKNIESSTESPCLKEYKKNKELSREQAHASIIIKWEKEFNEKKSKEILNALRYGVKKLRDISGWNK